MDIRDLLCMILALALVAISTSRSGGYPKRAKSITFLSPSPSRKYPVPPGPEGQKLLAYIPSSNPTADHGKGQQVDLYV